MSSQQSCSAAGQQHWAQPALRAKQPQKPRRFVAVPWLWLCLLTLCQCHFRYCIPGRDTSCIFQCTSSSHRRLFFLMSSQKSKIQFCIIKIFCAYLFSLVCFGIAKWSLMFLQTHCLLLLHHKYLLSAVPRGEVWLSITAGIVLVGSFL